MGKREKKRLEKRRREQEEREREEREREERERREREMMDERRRPIKATMALAIGSLVYYHCAYRNSSFVTLLADVFIVILCSLAVSGLFSRQMNIQVPVDPLEWQMTEETANTIVAGFANTVGAAESVLRVAATGHDKRLFFKVVISLIFFSAIGRIAPGHTVAYTGLWLFCLYIFVRCSRSVRAFSAWLFGTPNGDSEEQDPTL
uniref:Reticulon domain-containing protein n=1 Tax=Phaseolus vulgaris TaxID=3885 RepID=V7ATC8_PHAVU|nr:hypothetical protein PHAVU_010G164400g [Phaseolus vulgaris]ESW07858.1 hypothetical protein PHAVU_010G164400g [Phaseolus vulgaris]